MLEKEEKGETKKSFNGTWSINYKWKPPEENTIDFKVRVVKDKTKNGLRDKITSTMIKGKVVKCKQVRLYVGYDVKEGKQMGLISEEVAETIPELAIMKDGKPKNVDYQKLAVVLLAEVQNLKKGYLG